MPAFPSYHLSKSRVSALSTTPFHICASEVLGMFFHVGPKKEKRKERKRGRNKKQPKNALQKRVPEFSTSTTTSCTIGHPLYCEQALRMLPLLRKEHPAKKPWTDFRLCLTGESERRRFLVDLLKSERKPRIVWFLSRPRVLAVRSNRSC